MRDVTKSTRELVAECTREHIVGYAEFRELLDTVEAHKTQWAGHERLIVPRSDAKGDPNSNRLVLLYHVPTKTIHTKSFAEALVSSDFDHSVLHRLNGFEDFGTWSQKGDYIYLVWSREEPVIDFLPEPKGIVSQVISYFW
jgi:hypothetical protein